MMQNPFCFNVTINTYGTYNWKVEFLSEDESIVIIGKIVVDDNEQECTYTGPTDTDN